MEEKLEQAYLYDFYGELLNEHQRQVYEDFVFNDLSLGEIASEEGISRQGVADLIKRCNKKLLDYEAKLHLVEKFMSIKSDIRRIHELTNDFKKSHNELLMNEIEAISNQILIWHLTVYQKNCRTFLRISAARESLLRMM